MPSDLPFNLAGVALELDLERSFRQVVNEAESQLRLAQSELDIFVSTETKERQALDTMRQQLQVAQDNHGQRRANLQQVSHLSGHLPSFTEFCGSLRIGFQEKELDGSVSFGFCFTAGPAGGGRSGMAAPVGRGQGAAGGGGGRRGGRVAEAARPPPETRGGPLGAVGQHVALARPRRPHGTETVRPRRSAPYHHSS